MAPVQTNHIEEVRTWFNHGTETPYITENLCENRFVFNSRLNSYENILKKTISENCLYLILASLGEIGNNCFDHNLGHWQEKPGCLFVRENNFCIIADRGQGIQNSLSQVIKLENKKYVDYAYTHIISGRAPERRGNGLKFVKKSIETCKTSIFTNSGNEIFKLGVNPQEIKELNNQGVLTILSW